MENAIIHGLSKKEDGGSDLSLIWSQGEREIVSGQTQGWEWTSQALEGNLRTDYKGAIERPKYGYRTGKYLQKDSLYVLRGNVQIYSTAGRGTVHTDPTSAAEEPEIGRGKDVKVMFRLLIADDEIIERAVLHKTLHKNLKGTRYIFLRLTMAAGPEII